MMLKNALAGVAVSDIEAAVRWYTQLLGREPDERPMQTTAEWRFSQGGWLQLFRDARRAGSSSVTLVETDVEKRVAELRAKGLRIVSSSATELVATAIIGDPDGNQIVFAEARSKTNRSAA